MKRRHATLVIVLVGAGLALCIGAVATQQLAEDEKSISIDQVPAAVKAALLAQAQGGAIEEIEMESENGQAVYEAEVTIDGKEVEVRVAADGSLIARESDDEDNEDEGADDEDEDSEQLSLDQVPELLRTTILNEAQGGTIKEIERGRENGQVTYEADVVINGQEVELKIGAKSGKLIGREAAADEADTDERD